MSKTTKNAAFLGCLAVGAMIVAATADVKGEKGNCSGCPSQKLVGFLLGEGDGCGSAKVTLAKAEEPVKAGCSATCNKAMSDLPQITYRVGDLDTPCSKTADAASREKTLPVKFVVAGEVYDECGPAAVKLASLLEKQMPSMGEIVVVNESAPSASGCPLSGGARASGEAKTSYKVAGITFTSMKEAEAAQTKVRVVLANYINPADVAPSAGCPHAAEMANKATCGGAKIASDTPASAPAGCCMKKAAVATASEKSDSKGCCASMKPAPAAESAQVASAVKLGVCCDLNTINEGGCCPSVQTLVAVRAKVRSLVEAAMSAQTGAEQTASL